MIKRKRKTGSNSRTRLITGESDAAKSLESRSGTVVIRNMTPVEQAVRKGFAPRSRHGSDDGDTTRASEVRFGNVVIRGAMPRQDIVKINIERSTEALERVTKRLVTPGVILPYKKNVPRFSVAEGENDVFVRRLNGRTERGRLVGGMFQVIE